MKIDNKLKRILIGIVLLTVIVLIIVTIQLSAGLAGYSERINQLVKEIDNSNQRFTILEENFRNFSSGSNEVRRILSLPEQNWIRENSDENSSENTPDSTSDSFAFFNAIDYLLTHYDIESMESDIYNLLVSETMVDFLRQNNLELMKKGPASYHILKSGNLYFTLISEIVAFPELRIETAISTKKTFNLSELVNDNNLLVSYLNGEKKPLDEYYLRYGELKKEFKTLSSEHSFTSYLESVNLQLSKLESGYRSDKYSVYNIDRTFLIDIKIDSRTLKVTAGNLEFNSIKDFYKAFISMIEETDIRTNKERNVDEAKARVEAIFQDEAFRSYLENNAFTITSINREDSDYFYYDILNSDKVQVGSFAVQKLIGDIYLMDSEDVMISSLKYLESSYQTETDSLLEIPDNLPLIAGRYNNKSSTTFVVIGSHENNTDTIIVVHGDETTGKMTLIAIPRDLYYMERKINYYYHTYGGEKFTEILSEITGLSIEGYVAVDMYAFVDLINILGGIEINLESDLIDPTYMIRDNGKWSTLFYKKGSHHLNGIESLRIVRSRHTSSDFGRTARQELVLQGIKDKLQSFGFNDTGKILQLFQTMGNYLDTNFSTMDMLGLFMKYRNTTIEKKQGLSTFNVLYNTYTNIYELTDKSKQYEEGFYRGFWILLPRNNDWNVIKWYIRSLIDGTES